MTVRPAQLTFRAGLSRLLVGGTALLLVPLLYPRARGVVWVLGVYLAVACGEQVLIYKNIGGRVRALGAGIVDLFVITLFVHELGSTTSVFAAVYFFACALNALVVGLRVGVTLAALNALAYDAVVWLEWAGKLAFAPGGPDPAASGARPSLHAAVGATSLVTVLLVSTTAVVGMLVHSVRRHEQDLTAANARLEELTQRDPLTGLFNRRHLFAELDRELARARRGRPLSLIMLDLDGFKRVNDAQGHLRGDILLKEIATALGTSTRVVDVAARYGGDEFVILLPDTDAEQARAVACRVGAAVREVGQRLDPERPVTASMGVAVAHEDDSVASLLRRADESAYRAKRSGGDRVELSA